MSGDVLEVGFALAADVTKEDAFVCADLAGEIVECCGGGVFVALAVEDDLFAGGAG